MMRGKRLERKAKAGQDGKPVAATSMGGLERKPAVPTWSQLAKNNISHRSSDAFGDVWRRIGVDNDSPSLQSAISETYKRAEFNFDLFSEVKPLPGAVVSGAVELQRLKDKAEAAIASTVMLYNSGRPTWGTVDAYHSCFLTAKVILGIFGIFIVSLEGSNFFVDLFPSEGDRDYRKRFQLEYSAITSPARFLTIRGRPIEHRHVWELLTRICNKCTIECLDEKQMRWIKNFSFSEYSCLRNKVIYSSYFWSDLEDLHSPIGVVENLDDHPRLVNFDDNVWMNHDLRDHILMKILSGFMLKMFPFGRV